MDMVERIAQMQAPCGDGSSMGLRFIIALGLIEQSKMDELQDELGRTEALRVAYDVIRAAISEVLSALEEPSEATRIAGLAAYGENEERLKAHYEEPERQARDYGDVPMMPTVSVLIRNEDDSNAVWQAMLSQARKEIEG